MVRPRTTSHASVLASEAIPSTLKFDGANPLAALYRLLSKGMHAKTDDECLAIAEEVREVFEYVFSRLRAEIEGSWLGWTGTDDAHHLNMKLVNN